MLRRERRSSVAADTEYAFRHVLMRDVAYGQIPRVQRADKHQRAAAWIESLSADRGDVPDMLAHHYARALEYARDTGQPTEELELRTRMALRDAGDRPGRSARCRPPSSTTTRRSCCGRRMIRPGPNW